MKEDLSWSDKLGCAGGLFVLWLIAPFPFWLLGSGFAGKFLFLPVIDTAATDAAIIGVLFWTAFYVPLLLIAALLWSAVKQRGRDKRFKDSDDAAN